MQFFGIFLILLQATGEGKVVLVLNHLTPELNPSAQCCLTRFLLMILLLEQSISLIYA
jgi:hypothetical protein